MKKWNYIFLIISILFYFLIMIFPIHSGTLLVLSFCIGLIYFYIVWNLYPNYQLPLYLLFLFRYLLNEELGEVTFLLIILLLFYTVLINIFERLKLPRNYFLMKASVLELLAFITILISTILPFSFYYIAIIFFIFFMGNRMLYSFLTWSSFYKLSKEKIIVNNEVSFKNLYKTKNIIFNKTGTLTLGEFTVSEVETNKEKLFWKYLSYAEATRDNRIATYIRTLENYQKVDLKKRTDYHEFRHGIIYQYLTKRILVGNKDFLMEFGIDILEEELVGTYIYVAENNKILGHITLSDKVNLNIKKIISEFKDLGINHFTVFSNDQDKLTTTVSRSLGIRDSYGNLTSKKGDFWLYYQKQIHGNETIYIHDDDTNYDVKVKINLSNVNSNNDKDDIIILEHNLKSCIYLLKLSKVLHQYQAFWIVIISLGQFLLAILSLLFFNKIWMIALFSLIWMLIWISFSTLKIVKSWEE